MPENDIEVLSEEDPQAEQELGADFETVGTGSVFAIGCTVVVMIITLVGVAMFILRQT